jgi:uncharacterized membrane protein SirB2
MEIQLLVKIMHMSVAALLILAIALRATTLFVGTLDGQPSTKARVALVGLQHLALTLVALTGIVALLLKDFQVEPWFYAKVVLFLVLVSSLMKTYRKDTSVDLAQRRAGLFLAVVALIGIIGLVIIKPNFG